MAPAHLNPNFLFEIQLILSKAFFMKMNLLFLIISTFFISYFADATPFNTNTTQESINAPNPLHWDELSKNKNYQLQNYLPLGARASLPAGTPMKLIDTYALSPVQVMFFQFQLNSCPSGQASQKTEIMIINQKIGVEREPNCLLNIYVELKDFYTPSIFLGSPAVGRMNF